MARKGCFSRVCSCITTTVTLGIIGVLLWHFLGRPSPEEVGDFAEGVGDFISDFDFGDFTDVLSNLTDLDWQDAFNEDPFVGDNTTNAWQTDGYGLELEMQNALDDMWQTEYAVAVGDWNESPVLSLSTRTVDVDHACTQVRGVMKVCNGNYGDTGWLGINEVIIESTGNGPRFIVSSVAKMNEYYLLNADYPKRQYTMCHEIGHGFGLPHTDENHNNVDLGNCLDYTNTPENNMHPDYTNFQRLQSIYQRPDGTRRTSEVAGDGEVRRYLYTYYLWDY